MKKSIKILATLGIIFLLSFSTYAQTDVWSGQWTTKYGQVTITKNSNGFTGTFPKGKLFDAREQDGMLLGRYTRLVGRSDKSSLGNKGEFRFILSADKTKFDGYHKSETDEKWGSENWLGEKVWGMVMPVIVSNNMPTIVNWTGTWETDTYGRFKVLETSNTNGIKIKGRFFIKGGGDFMDIFDVEGTSNASNPKVFTGSFKHDDRSGYFKLTYGSPTDNDFSGYLSYRAEILKQGEPKYPMKEKHHAKTVWVKGTRTSSAIPNMNDY